MAIRSISDSISRGDINIGIAAGYESMSSQQVSFYSSCGWWLLILIPCSPRPTPVFHSPEILEHQAARDSAEVYPAVFRLMCLGFTKCRFVADGMDLGECS